MKFLLILFGLGLGAGPALAGDGASPDLIAFQTCVTQLHRTNRFYSYLIPTEILRIDKSLFRLSRGISYLEQNYNDLVVRSLNGATEPEVVRNAVESCEVYRNTFSRRFRLYGIFLLGLIGATIFLTLKVFFNMVPKEKRALATGLVEVAVDADEDAETDVKKAKLHVEPGIQDLHDSPKIKEPEVVVSSNDALANEPTDAAWDQIPPRKSSRSGK